MGSTRPGELGREPEPVPLGEGREAVCEGPGVHLELRPLLISDKPLSFTRDNSILGAPGSWVSESCIVDVLIKLPVLRG